jgi:hypothetical protein
VSERKDRVDLQGGVVHLPAEYREVARKANQAGLEGYQYVDLEYGIDLQAAIDLRFDSDDSFRKIPVRVEISYRKLGLDEESDRQAVLLALAELALSRPGWNDMLRRIATTLAGEGLYDEFKRLNADQGPPEGARHRQGDWTRYRNGQG